MAAPPLPGRIPEFVSFAMIGPGDPDPERHPDETDLFHARMAPRRRSELLRGRSAARLALERLGHRDVAIPRGANREPIWPPGIVGSITHTSGVAMAAVAERSHTDGIGIDLEHHSRWFDGLADKTTTPTERRRLGRLDGPQAARATIEIFSVKEALFKALYPRVERYFGFSAAETFIGNDGLLRVRLVEPIGPAHPAGLVFAVHTSWASGMVLATLVLPAGNRPVDVPTVW